MLAVSARETRERAGNVVPRGALEGHEARAYTRDFPYVWDEVTSNIANGSDLRHAAGEAVARSVLGDEMTTAASRYQQLLEGEGLSFGVEEVPRVFVSLADSWTDCTVRYVVPVRTRRHWASSLSVALSEEIARPEHAGRILGAYPRTEVNLRPNRGTTSSGPRGLIGARSAADLDAHICE